MKTIDIINLGCIDYQKAYCIQKQYHRKRQHDLIPNTLILAQHPHVITCGRLYNDKDIVNLKELESRGIPIIKTDRGGGITYHGPGQIMTYPIFDLKTIKKDIHFYIMRLENTIIDLLTTYSIKARSKNESRGVWVKNKKIASIGVGISRWITYHGACLNVDTDMDYFKFIKPCGLPSDEMISMKQILNIAVDIAEVEENIIKSFKKNFI